MKNQTYPTDLTNRQWNGIKDLIPPAKTGGRPRTVDPRQVINAIFSVVVGGIQWRRGERQVVFLLDWFIELASGNPSVYGRFYGLTLAVDAPLRRVKRRRAVIQLYV